MKILLDTNILLRLAQPTSPLHPAAVDAMIRLEDIGTTKCLVPQVIYEYWAVATRPVENNGLGMSVAQVAQSVQQALAEYPLLRDERGVFRRWLPLVTTHDVKGKNAHDARLVAAMQRHGVTNLLTFNGADFARFPAISVLSPTDVLAGRVPV